MSRTYQMLKWFTSWCDYLEGADDARTRDIVNAVVRLTAYGGDSGHQGAGESGV